MIALRRRLQVSPVYDIYQSFKCPQLLRERATELAFYRALLPPNPHGALAFDIGANQGAKTDLFLRLGARVIAVDPDPENQRALRQKFHARRWKHMPVVIVPLAVSDRNGAAKFFLHEPGSGKNTLNAKWVETLAHDSTRFGTTLAFNQQLMATTITLDQLIVRYGRPAFAKIDVEGHEPEVLRGLSQPIPALTFECNLPEFREEGQACCARLAELDPAGLFNMVADCRRHGVRLSTWQDASAFADTLNRCGEPSIEVVWRSLASQ